MSEDQYSYDDAFEEAPPLPNYFDYPTTRYPRKSTAKPSNTGTGTDIIGILQDIRDRDKYAMNSTRDPSNTGTTPPLTRYPRNSTRDPSNTGTTPHPLTRYPRNSTRYPSNTGTTPPLSKFPRNSTRYPKKSTIYPTKVDEVDKEIQDFIKEVYNPYKYDEHLDNNISEDEYEYYEEAPPLPSHHSIPGTRYPRDSTQNPSNTGTTPSFTTYPTTATTTTTTTPLTRYPNKSTKYSSNPTTTTTITTTTNPLTRYPKKSTKYTSNPRTTTPLLPTYPSNFKEEEYKDTLNYWQKRLLPWLFNHDRA